MLILPCTLVAVRAINNQHFNITNVACGGLNRVSVKR